MRCSRAAGEEAAGRQGMQGQQGPMYGHGTAQGEVACVECGR